MQIHWSYLSWSRQRKLQIRCVSFLRAKRIRFNGWTICSKLTHAYMVCKKLLTYGYTCVYCCIFSTFINVYNCSNGNWSLTKNQTLWKLQNNMDRKSCVSIYIWKNFPCLPSSNNDTDWLADRKKNIHPVYYTIDGSVISRIVFLQILTVGTSNTVCNESRIAASKNTDKKITKLSMQVMSLFCCFTTPQLIMYVLREFIQDKLNGNEKSLVGFFIAFSSIILYANSFANAVLFLMTNVKANRFLRSFGR